MGIEADRIIAEATGWRKVASQELVELRDYSRYALEKDGTLTVRFPDGTIIYNFSPTTSDSAALEAIKALRARGLEVLVGLREDERGAPGLREHRADKARKT